MKFKLQIEVADEAIFPKSNLIREFSNAVNSELTVKNYGKDIEQYSIGLLIVNPPIGYEQWYKVKKPAYVNYKETISKHSNEKIILTNCFAIELKITGKEYEIFLGPNEESEKVLAKKILESLSNLDFLPKKVKDFDKERFKNDMRLFFKDKGYI